MLLANRRNLEEIISVPLRMPAAVAQDLALDCFDALLTLEEDLRIDSVPRSSASRDSDLTKTEAYFTQSGWEAVAGIGAFYRLPQRTFGTRLAPGTGIDLRNSARSSHW